MKLEPAVTEDKKLFLSGEFEVWYDYPECKFIIKPIESAGGKIIRNLKESSFPRRNVKQKYELSYEKIDMIAFDTEWENVVLVIKKLMTEPEGEEKIIEGIIKYCISMVSSPYAIIENENNYDENPKTSSDLKKSSCFGFDNANPQEASP